MILTSVSSGYQHLGDCTFHYTQKESIFDVYKLLKRSQLIMHFFTKKLFYILVELGFKTKKIKKIINIFFSFYIKIAYTNHIIKHV